MAEQFVEELYRYSNIIFELERTVEEIRLFKDSDAAERLDRIFPELTELCRKYINDHLEEGKILWKEVKALTEIDHDLVAIGDHIELNILPDIHRYLSSLADIDVDINPKYSIRSTVSGFLTLYDKTDGLLLHSKKDPMFEAMQYVRSFYDASKNIYYVFGCGMGYNVYQLYEQSDGFAYIVLYEPDDIVYNTAESYGVLSWIPDDSFERRKFINADDFLKQALSENAGVLINITSVHAMEDSTEKVRLVTYWMWQNTVRQFEGDKSVNRIRNAFLCYPDAEKYIEDNKCDDAVVVAAGPSLSEKMDILKDWVGSKTIIAVGNVYQKLIDEGVTPDCIIMIDPTRLTLRQLPDIETNRVPMLLDDNVYWKLPRIYKGPMYFMNNWSYTGTVSSAAIETALHMEAKRVYLIGLDLGYPILQSHADGIGGNRPMSENGLFKVERTDGEEVFTDKHLNYYREQIEIQIRNHPDVIFYNLSDKGARIYGTIRY